MIIPTNYNILKGFKNKQQCYKGFFHLQRCHIISPQYKLYHGNKVRTAGPSAAPPVERESPTRQTHQKPLHSLCKMAQLKGIDLQVNTMVVICERMVFDFNWLLQSNHWL